MHLSLKECHPVPVHFYLLSHILFLSGWCYAVLPCTTYKQVVFVTIQSISWCRLTQRLSVMPCHKRFVSGNWFSYDKTKCSLEFSGKKKQAKFITSTFTVQVTSPLKCIIDKNQQITAVHDTFTPATAKQFISNTLSNNTASHAINLIQFMLCIYQGLKTRS